MRKFNSLLITVFVFFLLFSFANIVNAACEPPECGTANTGMCEGWGPEFQCLAKCCVVQDPGDGGGGGGGGPSCPAGSDLSCGRQSEAYSNIGCTNPSTCNDRFASFWGTRPLPDACDPNGEGFAATCYTNCSCCPSGTSRSFVNGSNYTFTAYSTSRIGHNGQTI